MTILFPQQYWTSLNKNALLTRIGTSAFIASILAVLVKVATLIIQDTSSTITSKLPVNASWDRIEIFKLQR